MTGAWKALVLLAGLAAVACVAQRGLSYEEIVTQALKFFNHDNICLSVQCITQNAQGEMNSTDSYTSIMCVVGIQNIYFKIGNQIYIVSYTTKRNYGH